MGTLCAQLPLQFNSCDHAFKICILFGYNPRIIFCQCFHNLNIKKSHFFGHFSNGQRVPCVRNSSYSLIPILLKLYRHCDHALKICISLGYTPHINFCHFFLQFELFNFQTLSHLESDVPVGGIVFHKHIF